MKYYLFLTTSILNIGGGHIYTLNKIKYLKSVGYDTDLFHADMQTGEIVIKNLIPYKKNGDWHLQYPCYFFGEIKQKEIIEIICNKIPKGYDEIIVESQTMNCATWGELIAKELGGKHFVYLLAEQPRIPNKGVYKFLKFKLGRKELVGIQPDSIPTLFKNWTAEKVSNTNFLIAHCSNVVQDISYNKDLNEFKNTDFVISSIGRIDKLFLIESLYQIVNYVNKHKNKTFSILLIGGTSVKSIQKRIEMMFKNVPNVKLHITGLIYPIPQELIMLADVFISSSGSALLSYSLGKPTISIDGNDNKPIGVVGYTTDNTLFRSMEPIIELEELLTKILFEKKYIKSIVPVDKVYMADYSYLDHINYVQQSDQARLYYNFSEVNLSLKELTISLMLRLLGRTFFSIFLHSISPIWMKINKIK